MSVHRVTTSAGPRYRVRWREQGEQKSKTFVLKRDADDYDATLRRLAAQGELAHELARRRATVSEYIAMWATTRAGEVAADTAAGYARHFKTRILPELGQVRVTTLTPTRVEQWIAWMRQRGDNDATILKACTALQSALGLAVKDGTIPSNPVAGARRPHQGRKRVPYLVKPTSVERMRAHLIARGDMRDVVLLELLAYAGLRPESEAIVLPWLHVRDRSLLIIDTKRKKERSVPMVDQLRESLDEWRGTLRGPLVVPARPGHTWDEGSDGRAEWRYWRRHVFAPAAKAAGLPADVRPRDLRGSFVSLLVHEGRNIVEVARRCGHGPEVCLRDYAQVFDDFDPADRKPAEDLIREARDAASAHRSPKDVPSEFPTEALPNA